MMWYLRIEDASGPPVRSSEQHSERVEAVASAADFHSKNGGRRKTYGNKTCAAGPSGGRVRTVAAWEAHLLLMI
jgi:hypothetical protein